MRTFIVTLSLVICFFISFGQNFQGGPILGFTATQVDGDTYSGYNKAGVIIGGFVNKKFSEKWSSQLEIKYIQKGSKKIGPSDIAVFRDEKKTLDNLYIIVETKRKERKAEF